MGENVTDTQIIVTHFAKTAICGTKQSTAIEEEATNIKALAEMRRVVTETLFEITEVFRGTTKQ